MLKITWYSALASITWVSAFSLLYWMFRKNTRFIQNYGVKTLILFFACTIFRATVPLRLRSTTPIPSKKLLTAVGIVFSSQINIPFWGSISILTIVVILWAVGFLIYLMVTFVGIYKYRKVFYSLPSTPKRVFAEIYPVSDDTLAMIASCNAKIIVAENFPTPMIFGYFVPTLLLPNKPVDSETADFIVLHELQHHKNKDSWVKLFVEIIIAIYWWNPLMYLLKAELEQTLEIKCDLNLIGNMGVSKRKKYLLTILEYAKAPVPDNVPALYASHLLSSRKKCSRKNTKQRFDLILDYHPRFRLRVSLVHIIMLILLYLSYRFVAQPHYMPSIGSYREGGITAFEGQTYKEGDKVYFVDDTGLTHEITRE